MSDQKTTSILDMLREKEREREAERRKAQKKRRAMVALVEKQVLPLMPRSLRDCYYLSSVSTTFGGPGAVLSFEPTVDMHNNAPAKKAIGTIDKVVAGLKRGGWLVTRPPEAQANHYRKDMSIELAARRPNDEQQAALTMTFNGINATERCRLVEKEVIIGAVPEHTETKLVVECSDPEAAP